MQDRPENAEAFNAGNPLKAQVPVWRGTVLGVNLTGPGIRVQTRQGVFVMQADQLSWALHGRVTLPTEHRYGRRAMRLRGAAALAEMLAAIGDERHDDQTVVRLLTENELELRVLLKFALRKFAGKKDRAK